MAMKTVSTKVDEDKEIYQRIEELQEQHDTKSEAIRHALREGVDDTDSRIDRALDGAERALYASVMFVLAVAGLSLAEPLLGDLVIPVATVPLVCSGALSLVALGRGLTAAGLLRAKGYTWTQMLRIAFLADSPDLSAGAERA